MRVRARIWSFGLSSALIMLVRAAHRRDVARLMLGTSVLIVATVFTRYDGWIVAAAVWCVIAWTLSQNRDVWRRVLPSFTFFTILTVAGPLSWLAYNQHFFHDALDFMRGPYSASAIEKKTSPPGSRW